MPQIKPARHFLLTIDYPPRTDGGVSQLMKAFAEGSAAENHDLRILTRRQSKALDGKVIELWGRSWRKHHPLWIGLQLPPLVKNHRPATVFCADHHLAHSLIHACKKRRFKVVTWTHGMELCPEGGRVAKMRQTLENSDGIVVTNQWSHKRLLALGLSESLFIHAKPCINNRILRQLRPQSWKQELGWPQSGKVLLSLSRLIPRKGHMALLEAFTRLKDKFNKWHLVIVGDGPIRLELTAKIGSLGLESRVHILGFVDDNLVANLYEACDLYAMLSHERKGGQDVEGFGITYLEAGRFAKAVVAGRGGGIMDAVVHGQTGMIVQDPNNIDEIVHTLGQLMGNEALRHSLGLAGQRRVLNGFTPAHMAAAIYGQLSAPATRPGNTP